MTTIDRDQLDHIQHVIEQHSDVLFTWDYERSRPALAKLYEKAKTSQWNAATDLDWSIEVDLEKQAADSQMANARFNLLATEPDSPLKNWGEKEWRQFGIESQTFMMSQFLHGEQGALVCTGLITATTPWIDAKYYAATQVMDEARHVEVFARYIDEKLGGAYKINANLGSLLDKIVADNRWDVTYLGMQIMVEGLALAAFGFLHMLTQEPLLKQLLRYVMSDEARHVAFGVLSLKEFYAGLDAQEIRERQEFAYEAAVQLKRRFMSPEVFEKFGADPKKVIAFVEAHDDPGQNMFQSMLFSKIVPNCRKLGILDAGDGWLRTKFEELDIIQFEHNIDTTEEYGTLDAFDTEDIVVTAVETKAADPLLAEVNAWLADQWDPELTLAEWWERLGTAGWAAPTLPEGSYGRGLSRSDAVRVGNAIAAAGAVGAPSGLGLLLAAPTIATHGTREQIDTYVRDIVTGQRAWCQLFSEPGAGSDLAGLTTKAVRDGDEWIITGQKVWTSMGQTADMGMLLARTDPDAPKHQGITWFAIDMRQPGVDIRPLRELTGHAMFNEVFLEEARVPHAAVIGELNNGWAAANTTLANERAGLGAGGGMGGAMVMPGQVAGQLGRRAGDFTSGPKKGGGRKPSMPRRMPSSAQLLIDLAKGNGTAADATVRQGLVQLHIKGELGRLNGERLKAAKASGGDIPGMANIAKLAMSDIVRLQRDLGLQIVGPYGTLHAYDETQRKALDAATGNPFLPMVTGTALYAQAPPIYGGTDQIQRNIIGERVLGLPKEPGHDSSVPFSSLPRNA